jgi:hypothetical protein
MDTNIITLKAKTNQEAFDMVVRHLKNMPRRAVTEDADCVYETEDDKNKCAIGALLVLDSPRKHKWAKRVRASISDLVCSRRESAARRAERAGVEPFCVMPGNVDVSLLQAMQRKHDDSGCWNADGFSDWGWDAMRAIAFSYGLNTKALDALGV